MVSGVEVLQYVLAGLGVGVVFGMFGAGGSAFATPVLALLGVPGLLAVASPLPAMLPASYVGARRYLRSGNLDRRVAKLAVIGGVPGVLIGALASNFVGGPNLLVLSGLLLLGIGVRFVLPDRAGAARRAAGRRDSTAIVVGASFGVGLLTGLLANGGGFLLVPVFVLVLGLTAVEAAGTSMVVVGILTVPTLATHWALGHIDWTVAAGFAAGLIPGAAVGARIAQRISAERLRAAFGIMLIVFSIFFLVRQLGWTNAPTDCPGTVAPEAEHKKGSADRRLRPPAVADALGGMCRQTTCSKCWSTGWAACGCPTWNTSSVTCRRPNAAAASIPTRPAAHGGSASPATTGEEPEHGHRRPRDLDNVRRRPGPEGSQGWIRRSSRCSRSSSSPSSRAR